METVGAVLFIIIWVISIIASLLITAALVALAGDVLGLWEVVSFV